MKKLKRLFDRVPRPARVFIDLLLAAALLLCATVARGFPFSGEDGRFRRAEQAAMVGPSRLLDRFYVHGDWPFVNYTRLLIGDDGDTILFFCLRTGTGNFSTNNVLVRREKTDGILLTTLPVESYVTLRGSYPGSGELSVPLLLFVDDPAAVKARLRMPLSDGSELTLVQIRDWHNHALLSESEKDGYVTGTVRDGFFLFDHPVTETEWESDWVELMEINGLYGTVSAERSVTIELYDADNELIRTVDYTIRSRAGDAMASERS